MSQALTPQYGGSAFSEASLSGALTRQSKTNVTVLCRQGAVDEDFVAKHGKITVHQYKPFQWVMAWLSASHPLRQMIRDCDAFHLNGHWRWENYFVARICVAEEKPYLLQPRGMLWLGHRRVWLKRIFQKLIGNYIVRKAHRLVALSKFELSHWAHYRLPDSQVMVLPNGVLGSGEEGGKSESTPEPTAAYFLYLGRLESRKNLVFLLEAFLSYRRRGGQAELWLVGPVERGYDQSLRKSILKMGLTSHVRLLPPVYSSGKKALMKNSLAVVYPAIEEPFGRVPFEALDAGTFTVIPKRSGSAEYIGEFLPELVYTDGDKQSLVSVLWKTQEQDKSMQQRREKAQHWVQKELHWDKMVGRYLDLYRNLLITNGVSGGDRDHVRAKKARAL